MISANTLESSQARSGSLMHVAEDVAGLQIVMVNVYFVGHPVSGDWVLIDAALPMSAGRVAQATHERFDGRPPVAIVLTHGHFDHVGALRELADRWDVSIYAHRLEMPYLTGRSDYPPPDPTVGGGMMARMSSLYPKHAYDFRPRVRELPADGTVPGMPGWRWIETPGIRPGMCRCFAIRIGC
jgi:glyoxylase-like metal-dependent hydrolase (beta-lactamase superfamily II)